MITYKNVDYETAEALRDAINTELAALAYPYTVNHKTYGEGQLTFVKVPLMGPALYATIEFATGIKTISLDVAFAGNLLNIPEILEETLLEAQTIYKEDFITREQAQRTANRLALEEACEAKKKAEVDKKAEEQYNAAREKALKDFDILTKASRPVSDVDEFYYSLGWLTNHVGSITAQIPDYLGPAFEQHFGSDAPKTLIDSKAKSIGGFAKKWTWSFSCSIKKLKDTIVPSYIQNMSADISKGIHNTSFIWDLVENYGFQFGKTQDIDRIKSNVPKNYIEIFESGITA